MTTMRLLEVLVVACGVVGCGATNAPVASPIARVVSEPQPEGCPLRARVVFRQLGADGSETLLALHCDYAGPQLEIGEHYEWGEGGSERIALERDEADAIWRVVRASDWRDWDSCAAVEPPRWSVEIDDGSTALMEARCSGELPHAWRAIYDALDAAQPRFEEVEWPFDGDYWRDELVYYRP